MVAMDGCSQVYQLAAYARVWDKDPAKFERVNFYGACNVLDAALECGVQKVVITSTGGTIGPQWQWFGR